MRKPLAIAIALAAVAGAASTASADVLANWTFEVPPPTGPGPHAAQGGAFFATSFASGSHVSGATVFDNPVGNGSAESYSSNNWTVGDYYQFTTSTAGYTGIAIQWDQASSNTGPRDFNLTYSTDGTSFFPIGGMYSVLANAPPNTPWTSATYNPAFTFGPTAGPGALDNQTIIYFRMVQATTVSANGGTVAGGGTDRLDNVNITGTLIPAPGVFALAGAAGLIAIRRRRN